MGARQNGKFCPLYILNFVLLGANSDDDGTGLAPSMTSGHWTSHMAEESSVFIVLKDTWRQMTSDDVIFSKVHSIVLLGDADDHKRWVRK